MTRLPRLPLLSPWLIAALLISPSWSFGDSPSKNNDKPATTKQDNAKQDDAKSDGTKPENAKPADAQGNQQATSADGQRSSEAHGKKQSAEPKTKPSKQKEHPKQAKQPKPTKAAKQDKQAKQEEQPKPEEKEPTSPLQLLMQRLSGEKDADDDGNSSPAGGKTGGKTGGKADGSKATEGKDDTSRTAKVVQFTFRGELTEGPTPPGLFAELKPSLRTMVERMDAAAKDDEVGAVLLRLSELQIGQAKIAELRAAVKRIRDHGKPVVAMLTTAQSAEYAVAAACDEVIMAPSGTLIIPGVRLEVTFLTGLLEKVGIHAEVLQVGKYKGAGEPFTRKSLSKPLRKSLSDVANDLYVGFVETVATDRHMPGYKVKTLIDQGIFTAAAAKREGLVDRLLYEDQVREWLAKKLKADQVKLATDYGRKKVEMDFSGFTGMLKLFELMLGGKPDKQTSATPKVALVHVVGPIIEAQEQGGLFGSQSATARTIVKALEDAGKRDSVKAVVLRVDSPGGSATASDLIWRAVKRLEKPVIASMGDTAASGGYYVAMGADQIIAARETLTGSIGVVGGKPVVAGLYEKLGLKTEVITRGENAGIYSATEPFSGEQRKLLQRMMHETYRQFVSKAAKGRGMEYTQLEKLAQGRVYSGRAAAKLGLIDRIGTLEDAIAEAKKTAGLKDSEKCEVIVLPRPKSLFEQLFGDPATQTRISSPLSAELNGLLKEIGLPVHQMKAYRQMFRGSAAFWMPYAIDIR